MSVYLLINIITFVVPFFMSFERKIRFYRFFPSVAFSIFVVGSVFIIWDYYSTIRNDWSFNAKYVLGIKLFSLPIEELLFFVTIPFASIFLFETAKVYLKEYQFNFPIWISIVSIIFFLLLSLLFKNQYYTFTVMIFSALTFFINLMNNNKLFKSKLYWIWILFTYIPFFIVNYFLTSLPVVEYSSKAICGIRVITIPLEDFLYSFSLLSLNLFFYQVAKDKWQEKK